MAAYTKCHLLQKVFIFSFKNVTYFRDVLKIQQAAGYAVVAPKKGKGLAVSSKKELEVESDPHKLVNYCCGANIMKGGEDPKLLPDSEYPEWLWKLRLGPPPPLEEIDQDTFYFWKRLRKINNRRTLSLLKVKELRKMPNR